MKLNQATATLFWIAADNNLLAQIIGVELIPHVDPKTKIQTKKLRTNSRQFLIERGGELAFDPDKFADSIPCRSTGTQHMMRFLLNVWNPHQWREKEPFDLFDAISSLDSNNAQFIADFINSPVFP